VFNIEEKGGVVCAEGIPRSIVPPEMFFLIFGSLHILVLSGGHFECYITSGHFTLHASVPVYQTEDVSK